MTARGWHAWRELLAVEAPASLAPALWAGAAGRRLSANLPMWKRARGAWVWDTRGRRYLDFVAGFGVASLGHAHPRVVAAVRRQAGALLHGYGDVHPHELRARLATRLARLGPWPSTRILWAQSGSEAVELAWKTAYLATGRPGIVALEGGYHGDSIGALSISGWPEFRGPFRALLPRRATWLRYGEPVAPAFARASRSRAGRNIGAVLVEPIQGRSGVIVPPPGYLREVVRQAHRRGWLVIADEIFTGLGRTGKRFAFEHDAAIPDLVLVGKSLAGGLPLAAVLGRASVMGAWRRAAAGTEAPHATTFLAHPLACAAALASLDVIERQRLASRAARLGRRLRRMLSALARSTNTVGEVRGRGLLMGIEIVRSDGAPDPETARAVVEAALDERLFVLASGRAGNVLSLTPPLTISEALLREGVARLSRALWTTLRPRRKPR